MAVINAGNLTLLDLTRRMDPKGNISPMVELMERENPFLKDCVFKQGNLPTGHKFVSRTALPTVEWRNLNQGVSTSKSKTDAVTETCGILTGLSKMDRDLAKLGGNEAAARLSESKGFMQAFENKVESYFFYGSTATEPNAINGLTPRLNSTTGPYPRQIIDAGMSSSGGDASSVWVVGWGDETVYGITPEGVPGGLQAEDLGKQLARDGDNKEFVAWVMEWSWRLGFCVQDAEFLVRVCNIDMGNILATGKLLITALVKAVRRMKSLARCRPVIYMHRDVLTYLELQALDTTSNSTITYKEIGGMPMAYFRGIPIRVSDGLLLTEATVT